MISEQEISSLKESYNLKKRVFELIRNNNKDEAKKILEENKEILSYFIKFKYEPIEGIANGKVILLGIQGAWSIHYNSYYENEIVEDLERIKREIEKKENRLEQNRFLKQQQEFINMQKQDLEESKKRGERIQNFTFILAFGVIVTSMFYLYQIILEFKRTGTVHTLIISGIFIMFFLVFILFIFTNFNMGAELKNFLRKQWLALVISAIVISLLLFFLYASTDREIISKDVTDSEDLKPTEYSNNSMNDSFVKESKIVLKESTNPKRINNQTP